MTAIERTAYPTFNSYPLNQKELDSYYTPDKNEIDFVSGKLRQRKKEEEPDVVCTTNYEQYRFTMLVLLKCFQRLGYFPLLSSVSSKISDHIQQFLQIPENIPLNYKHSQVLYRHQAFIRSYLKVKPYSEGGKEAASKIATESAKVHNYPADIINHVLEELVRKQYELPAYSQIDRLVKHTRHRVNTGIFNHVYKQLPESLVNKLEKLTESGTRTAFNKVKELPKSTTITHFKSLLAHHEWLLSFGSMFSYLDGISQIKLKHFSGEAKSLDASDIRNITEAKRYTLIVCLINEMQKQAKDNLILMFIKTMKKIEWKAKKKMESLLDQGKEKTRNLLLLLSDIVTAFGKRTTKKEITLIRKLFSDHGGQDKILTDCEQAIAYHGESHLPLICQAFRGSRHALFSLIKSLDIKSCTQDNTLIKAKDFLLANEKSKKELLPAEIDISFAPKQWQKLILQKQGKERFYVRKYLEICVFVCLAYELKSTDLYVAGSDSYTDFRDQLLPWSECASMVEEYCHNLKIPENDNDVVTQLRDLLSNKAKKIDEQCPNIKELVIDEDGNPILKKRSKSKEENKELESLIKSRMPKRKLLDVLVNVNHHTGWASYARKLCMESVS